MKCGSTVKPLQQSQDGINQSLEIGHADFEVVPTYKYWTVQGCENNISPEMEWSSF